MSSLAPIDSGDRQVLQTLSTVCSMNRLSTEGDEDLELPTPVAGLEIPASYWRHCGLAIPERFLPRQSAGVAHEARPFADVTVRSQHQLNPLDEPHRSRPSDEPGLDTG
jgi:hypothetical protein